MMDRISELPCDLLGKILFLLTKEEVARASVVSKRWCLVSTSFPVLVFNQPAFERDKNVNSWNIHKMERDFCDSVGRLIQRRKESPVETVEISIWNGEMAQEIAGRSIAYAMERNFKHLVLHYNRETRTQPGWHYHLPCSFWKYEGRRTLELQGCHYNRKTRTQPAWHYHLPCSFWKYEGLRTLELQGCNFSGLGFSLSNGFGLSLKKISLDDVKIDDRIFHNMISSCPVLEDLGIKSCTGFLVLNVVGPERIHKVDLKGSESQIVLIKVQGLEVLSYDGNSSKFTEIILNSFVENIREMRLVNIEVDNLLLPNFPWLEELELNNCRLDFNFRVSSNHFRTLKLIDCHYANCLVLNTLCLNRFHFKGHNELNVTWINASDEVEIELVLDPHGPFSNISFSNVAKFLHKLGFCKILTIVCGESKWIAAPGKFSLETGLTIGKFSLERGLTIKQLKMKIMRHYPQELSLTNVFADFLQISQRPVAVSAEVGEENTVDHVKLHFLYKHEVYKCKRGWCSWRSCLEELKVSQSSLQRQQD